MYSVDQFVRSYRKEADVCINLFNKMPPGCLDYRPTLGQRSTLELLRYLSYGPYNGVRRILAGDWTVGTPANDATKDMPPSDFPTRMNWQANEVERLVRATSVIALMNEEFTFPWGETLKKGEGLINYPLKWVTGYRLQLFLYLKAAGASHLTTSDAWRPPAV
jgi:hypothetical protein